jgi:cytochrome bd-type quinol oxidase subunit 1
MTGRRQVRALVLAAILGTALPASAWEIQWQTSEPVGRQPRVTGYVKNDSLKATNNLQLRVDRLAADGAVVGTTRTVLIGPMAGGDRLYFDVGVPDRAATYRVSVEAFDWFRCGD